VCIHTYIRIYIYIYNRVANRGTLDKYKGRLHSSWTHLIALSRKFVEVRWRSLFRSTSLAKRCTSYNAPPTSRKLAADRWSLKFVASEMPFHGWKSPEIVWGKIWIEFCVRLGKSGSVEPHQNIRHIAHMSPHAISGLHQPWKGSSEVRNFEVINGLQHVFEKWVERCKKYIAYQGKYFEKETVIAPPQSSDSE
jgi:hypothetical protein